MSKHITITATLAAWVSPGHSQRELRSALERGDDVRALSTLTFYGAPDRKDFADCARMGEADITVRLIPKDEQARLIVQALQAQLAEERVKWHQRQEAILAEIAKLSALEYVEAAE
jgi:predicted flavoprotein YhiN